MGIWSLRQAKEEGKKCFQKQAHRSRVLFPGIKKPYSTIPWLEWDTETTKLVELTRSLKVTDPDVNSAFRDWFTCIYFLFSEIAPTATIVDSIEISSSDFIKVFGPYECKVGISILHRSAITLKLFQENHFVFLSNFLDSLEPFDLDNLFSRARIMHIFFYFGFHTQL